MSEYSLFLNLEDKCLEVIPKTEIQDLRYIFDIEEPNLIVDDSFVTAIYSDDIYELISLFCSLRYLHDTQYLDFNIKLPKGLL